MKRALPKIHYIYLNKKRRTYAPIFLGGLMKFFF